jgi:uncharacterized transporter YbjL
MDVRTWSNSYLDYGRRILVSGLEGARSARETFRNSGPPPSLRGELAETALLPAAVGVCLGVLSSSVGRRRSTSKALAYGILGGAIGLAGGIVWKNRRLTASVTSGALRSINKVRDEHWLENNPIDYA